MENICKRKKATFTAYQSPPKDQQYCAINGSSLLIQGKAPYDELSAKVPIKTWLSENRRFAQVESKEKWTRVDLTDCLSVQGLRVPHVKEFRVVMREGCIQSGIIENHCLTPRVEISAPALHTFHLFFDGGKLPAVSNASWGYHTRSTQSSGVLRITNTSYLNNTPFGKQSCTHTTGGSGSTISCDWTRNDTIRFKDFSSNFVSLELLGLPDEILSLMSWERIESIRWERLLAPQKGYYSDFQYALYQTGLYSGIRAPALKFFKFNSVLRTSDPVPQFLAPNLETITLTALMGSDCVWDFDRMFQSYDYLNKVKTISIKLPSGLQMLRLKPFNIPRSTLSLSIVGCHAPWLLFDEVHDHGLQFVLPKLTHLYIDISQLNPQVRGESREIFLDISRKYPALRQLTLTAQMCSSYKFDGIDGKGIALDLVTSKTIEKLILSPFIGVRTLMINDKALSLEDNTCPKIPYYQRVWELTNVDDVSASVSRYFQDSLEQTDDYW